MVTMELMWSYLRGYPENEGGLSILIKAVATLVLYKAAFPSHRTTDRHPYQLVHEMQLVRADAPLVSVEHTDL